MNLIEVARRNSTRLVRLINDLLDMEKIDAGKLHFEITQQQVMPLIEQSLEENAGYALAHHVRFELTRSAGDASALVDAHRFQQVMANLLSNAAKFSPPDAVVEISAAQTENGLRIEVRDHGPGIPEAFRGSIFQMFCQADATDARSKSGTGLGLAICKAIVEGMGGQIGFETQLGAGTLFYFELPAALTTA
jgi:signal transduction histidine kinase